MTKDEALKLALEALEEISSHYMSLPKKGCMALAAIEEVLAQPEKCQCPACKITPHASDCAVHNEPAYPKGACNCGAQPEQEHIIDCPRCGHCCPQPEHEPVAWRNAALRVGEDLCSVGPFGYYDMTAEQWLDWALSVVTVHAPPASKPWVGLTDEDVYPLANAHLRNQPESYEVSGIYDLARAIEAKLREKNHG